MDGIGGIPVSYTHLYHNAANSAEYKEAAAKRQKKKEQEQEQPVHRSEPKEQHPEQKQEQPVHQSAQKEQQPIHEESEYRVEAVKMCIRDRE